MKLADAITERLAKLIGEIPSSTLEIEFYKNLIIALASNPKIACHEPDQYVGIDGINVKRNAQKVIFQADAIIKELDQ